MDNTEITSPPMNFGQPLAGQCLEWLPTDTKESFERLCQDPAHRAYFESKDWHKPGTITYNINSQGFRCEEFVESNSYLVALGCSFTVGVGLPLETIWPELMGQELGLKVANLAWGGNSADTCYRLAEYWIPKLQPKLVTMLAPPQDRIEVLLDVPSSGQFRHVPVDVYLPGALDSNAGDFLKHWFINEHNGWINQRKNIRAIKQLCAELNIPCIVLRALDFMNRSREEIGYARDAMHGGEIAHRRIADRMLNDWYAIQKS